MANDNLITAFIAGGGGTVLGSIIMGLIQSMGSKGRDRAQAADMSVSAASRIIDRLERENKQMRHSIILLTNAFDEIISDTNLTEAERRKLRKLNNTAREALSVETG